MLTIPQSTWKSLRALLFHLLAWNGRCQGINLGSLWVRPGAICGLFVVSTKDANERDSSADCVAPRPNYLTLITSAPLRFLVVATTTANALKKKLCTKSQKSVWRWRKKTAAWYQFCVRLTCDAFFCPSEDTERSNHGRPEADGWICYLRITHGISWSQRTTFNLFWRRSNQICGVRGLWLEPALG